MNKNRRKPTADHALTYFPFFFSPQPGFRVLSSNWRAHLQYKSLDKPTL